MFTAASTASLLWSDAHNSETTTESKQIQRLTSAAIVAQNVTLPAAEVAIGIEAQFQTAVNCGATQIAYQASGGSQPNGARYAEVNGNVSTNFEDAIQLVSVSAPAAKLIVKVAISFSAHGDLTSRASNFEFQHNGVTYPTGPMQGSTPISMSLSTTIEDPAAVPLKFSFGETFSFRVGESGNLTRALSIDSITIQDAQGNPIQLTYMTQSGNSYNIIDGTYGAATISAPRLT